MALFKLNKQSGKNDRRDAKSAEARPAGRIMSDEALASLGAPDVVYIREAEAKAFAANETDAPLEIDAAARLGARLGRGRVFVIYGADGSSLAVLGSREAAFAAALQNDLDVASLH